MHWGDSVFKRVSTFGPLAVGVDPVISHAPHALSADVDGFLPLYTSALLDAAQEKVGFVKFQSAFFEAFGSSGVVSLARCISMARERGFAVILDAKRGDISSTAEAYAQAYLTPKGGDLEVDCLTVNPFLGPDTIVPFLNCSRRYGKGLFILVKTSNEGSNWLQDRETDGVSVSHHVAAAVATWADETLGEAGISAVGAVVGATYPSEAIELRSLMPRSPFFAPGIGAQHGDPTTMAGLSTATGPILISASRGIAAVNDQTLPIEEYVEQVRQRIDVLGIQVARKSVNT